MKHNFQSLSTKGILIQPLLRSTYVHIIQSIRMYRHGFAASEWFTQRPLVGITLYEHTHSHTHVRTHTHMHADTHTHDRRPPRVLLYLTAKRTSELHTTSRWISQWGPLGSSFVFHPLLHQSHTHSCRHTRTHTWHWIENSPFTQEHSGRFSWLAEGINNALDLKY